MTGSVHARWFVARIAASPLLIKDMKLSAINPDRALQHQKNHRPKLQCPIKRKQKNESTEAKHDRCHCLRALDTRIRGDLWTKVRVVSLLKMNQTPNTSIIWQHLFFHMCTVCTCRRKYVSVYVCMYVCMHACMYACMYVCMSVYVCMYVCMYVYVGMCVRRHVCMYVWMYVSMYVCMYVCAYACMYVCVYVRMYVCTTVCMRV